MLRTWDAYVVMRNNIHEHPDYHTLKLVRVKYNDKDEIIAYEDCGPIEDLSLDTLIDEVNLMVQALEGPIINESSVLNNVIKNQIKEIKNGKQGR